MEVEPVEVSTKDLSIPTNNPLSTNSSGEDQPLPEGEEPEVERLETRKGPGRPKIIRTGKPGRPRKSPNVNTSNIKVPEEANSVEVLDPGRPDEALEGPDGEEWTDAIVEELKTHIENDTWEIVDHPSNHKPIGARYVFKTKLSKTGNKERRKARLVAKGFKNGLKMAEKS